MLPDEVRLLAALLAAAAASAALTPLAIRLATGVGFFDHPVGYKGHKAPTPYMGGAAVVVAVSLSAALFGQGVGRLWPLLACAVGLCLLGTLDDRVAVPPQYRVLAEVGAAAALWSGDLGWSVSDVPGVDLGLTVVWVVAFVNAFNLMDNMDGAGATAVAGSVLGVGALALLAGDVVAAAFSLAVAGACLGFLPFNLRSAGSARIFLGDGGSMALGFLVAALAMNTSAEDHLGWVALLAATLLLAVPALDTLLVIVSRRRRGISLLQGGRDHLTHRLRSRLGSPMRVAAVLAMVQAACCVGAILAFELGEVAVVLAAGLAMLCGAAAIVALEGSGARLPGASVVLRSEASSATRESPPGLH